jgi:nitrate reductase (cytochrome), electron transfer subunit
MSENGSTAAGWLAGFVVVCVAVVGYFTGLQSPSHGRTSIDNDPLAKRVDPSSKTLQPVTPRPDVIPAAAYLEMAEATRFRMATQKSSLSELRTEIDPLKEFTVSEGEKMFALQLRALNRAYNGAPPTVPHPIDQMSATSCMACHGEGFVTPSLRASKMSHEFLPNCTQCHVEQNPEFMQAAEFVESTFVGLPAPTGGPRAYEGAPPQIPHSTWMRTDCMSCHGFTGVQGIRTTHPWRSNCQQCHAPSSELEQVQLDSDPAFLAPIKRN